MIFIYLKADGSYQQTNVNRVLSVLLTLYSTHSLYHFQCQVWDKSSSSWSSDSVTTGSIQETGDETHVICKSTKTGFFAVFMDETQINATSSSPPVVSPKSASSQSVTVTAHSPTESPTATAETPTVAEIKFSFDVSYKTYIPDEAAKNEVQEKIREKLSETLGVAPSRITNLSIREGSILVSFILLSGGASEPNVSHALSSLQAAVMANNFTIVLQDGRKLVADATSLSVKYTVPITEVTTTVDSTLESPDAEAESALSTGAVAAITAVSIVVVLLVIASCVLYSRKMKTQRKVNQEDDYEREGVEMGDKETTMSMHGKNIRQSSCTFFAIRLSSVVGFNTSVYSVTYQMQSKK